MRKVSKSGKLVFGFGVNDADYCVIRKETINGKRKLAWMCPYYSRWHSMIKRGCSEKFKRGQPSYTDCTVCEEWKYFSNFKKWMMTQDWEGKHLDKDFLVKGNRTYSPDTCIFIHPKVNTFVFSLERSGGQHLIGANWCKNNCNFIAQCSNPLTLKRENLGRFNNERDAHLAWKKRKHEIACELADSEYVTDERIRVALRNWYK